MIEPPLWQWWVGDALIPTLGVLASTAVAVAAFKTSRRATLIAEQAHVDQLTRAAADDRWQFAELFDAEFDSPIGWERSRGVARSVVELAAEAAPAGATELATWYYSTFDAIAADERTAGKSIADSGNVRKLKAAARLRVRWWLRTGQAKQDEFEWEPHPPKAPPPSEPSPW